MSYFLFITEIVVSIILNVTDVSETFSGWNFELFSIYNVDDNKQKLSALMTFWNVW